MPIRAWGYVAALGLTLATSAQAQEPVSPAESPVDAEDGSTEGAQNGEESPADEQAEPTDLSPALQGIEAAIRDLIAEEDEREQRAQDERERRDLAAQEAMALWAEWMTYATGATVVLTFIGLVALIRTLHHTKRAADYTGRMLREAKKATEAAQDAVVVTREIGEAQARAYLSIERAAAYMDLGISDGPGISAEVTVRNYGQSPAKEVHFAVEVACTVKDERGSQRTEFIRSETWEIGVISPGKSEDSGTVGFGTMNWPPDVIQDERGAPKVGIGTVGVYAVDVFGKGIFETRPLKIAMTKEEFAIMRYNRAFEEPMMDLPNDGHRSLRSHGWSGPFNSHKKPKDWDEEG